MAIAIFTLFFAIFLLVNIADAESMRTQDPYISCFGQVPNNSNGLPAGYSPQTYYNPMQLCSALNGASNHVGCVCATSRENSFRCHQRIADPQLWSAVVTSSGKNFTTLCRESCECTNSRNAEEDRLQADLEYHYGRGRQGNRNSSQDNYHDPGDGNYQVFQGAQEQGIEHDQGWTHADTLNKDPVAKDQCGMNCTTNADCGVGGKGCMCSTQSEQYQPGSGTVAFLAACIISMAGSLPRREENRPCPCNATYVSHACCGVADGLVWEGEEFKLGELLTIAEL